MYKVVIGTTLVSDMTFKRISHAYRWAYSQFGSKPFVVVKVMFDSRQMEFAFNEMD